jgi:hypothetical protein
LEAKLYLKSKNKDADNANALSEVAISLREKFEYDIMYEALAHTG